MRLRLIVLGCFSLLVYIGLAWLSQSFVYGQGHRQRPILEFVALYASAFVLYAGALRVISNHKKVIGRHSATKRRREPEHNPLDSCLRGNDRHAQRLRFRQLSMTDPQKPIGILLGFAFLFRALLLFSNPIQEDDFYRYLWDGKVVAVGLNPYGVAPSTIEAQREGAQEYRKILENDDAFAHILARVNHPWVPTIYPPLAQGIFGLAALAAPGSLLGLRLVFFAFDMGVCLLIYLLLQHLRLNPAWTAVYAWSPLVVKETLNSAHYDVVPTFFLTLAALLMLQQRWRSAVVSLALAILGKIYPALLLPFFLWRIKTSFGGAAAFSGVMILGTVIGAGYAPFFQAGTGLWQGAVVFAEQWQTNSFLFPLLARLVGDRWLTNVMIFFILGLIVFFLLRRFDIKEDHAFLWGIFVALGLLFLLSPVGDPWYFVWLTPLLCVFPLRAWILLSGLLVFYYLSFYFQYHRMAETFRWVLWVEYLPFYGLLIYEWWNARNRFKASPSHEFC